MRKKNNIHDNRLAGSISGVFVCVWKCSVCLCVRAGASRQANTMQPELVLSGINITYKHKPRQYYGMHQLFRCAPAKQYGENIKTGVAPGLLHLLGAGGGCRKLRTCSYIVAVK
jgi:hypothetical protein